MDRQEQIEQVRHLREDKGLSWAAVGAELGFGPGKARTLYKEANPSGRTVGSAGERVAAQSTPSRRQISNGPTKRASKSGVQKNKGILRGKCYEGSCAHEAHTGERLRDKKHEWLFSPDTPPEEIEVKFRDSSEVEWVYPLGNSEKCRIRDVEYMYESIDDQRWIICFVNSDGHRKYCSIHRIVKLR